MTALFLVFLACALFVAWASNPGRVMMAMPTFPMPETMMVPMEHMETERHKGSNGAALAESKKARQLQAKQFEQQMAFAKQQAAAAEHVEIPRYIPAAPQATNSESVVDAGLDFRRSQARRFGSAQTRLAGERARPAMGGIAKLAA